MKLIPQVLILNIVSITALITATKVVAITITPGLSFTGSNINNSGFIPPDTMGAVGNNHIVELINGRYAVYNKTNGNLLQSNSLNGFWTSAGITVGGNSFDPRIIYDASSQHWFAISVDNSRNTNNFLLAVSKTSNPLDGWQGFVIDSDSNNSHWADFPTLGLSGNTLAIAANMFPLTAGSTDVNVTTLFLNKTDLIHSIITKTIVENIDPNFTGFSVQPVINFDNNSNNLYLYSDYNTAAGWFKRSVFDANTNTLTTNNLSDFVSVPAFNDPPNADQPGTKQNLHTGDTRLSSNIMLVNNSIWGVQTVNNNGNSALRWFQIDATTNLLLQSGLISDPNLDFYYGSIAVNQYNQVVIGFSGSSETQFVSTYTVAGDTIAGITNFTSPTLLTAGVADYERLDGSGRNRWGDYSATIVDPTNPLQFWTFQEFVSADNTWSIQITQLQSTPPVPIPFEFSPKLGLFIVALSYGIGYLSQK